MNLDTLVFSIGDRDTDTKWSGVETHQVPWYENRLHELEILRGRGMHWECLGGGQRRLPAVA